MTTLFEWLATQQTAPQTFETIADPRKCYRCGQQSPFYAWLDEKMFCSEDCRNSHREERDRVRLDSPAVPDMTPIGQALAFVAAIKKNIRG